MKVYLKPEAWLSRSIHKVAKALAEHAPKGVEIVDRRRRADLEILHVIGRGSIPNDVGARPYAVIQYCVRTTETPSVFQWLPLWRGADLVWSYYQLPSRTWLVEARTLVDNFPFYRAPLGVDARTFQANGGARDFLVGTSGYVAETESIEEVKRANAKVDGRHFHLGPEVNVPGAHAYAHDVTDAEVAGYWARCRYVSALRREEGFELPAYEGLLCGARPIAYDAPHYTQWLGESAVYIPEGTKEEVEEELVRVFSRTPEPVSEVERRHFAEMLDWERIAKGFWERAL